MRWTEDLKLEISNWEPQVTVSTNHPADEISNHLDIFLNCISK